MIKSTGANVEPLVKISIRDFIIYALFTMLVWFNALGNFSSDYYQLGHAFSSLFQSQYNVITMDHFWKFLEYDVLDGLYLEHWYNQGNGESTMKCPTGKTADGPCQIPFKNRKILFQNKLIGLPRLRQLRVRNDSCQIHEDFQRAIKVCYAFYSKDQEETRSFSPNYRNRTSYYAWNYQTAEELGNLDFEGHIYTYSAAGNMQLLSYTKAESLEIIRELKEKLWITQATRLVSLDFTVYNANTNIFCVVKLAFEFLSTGGIVNYQSFDVIGLPIIPDPFEFVLFGTETIFFFYIIYYIIEEVIEIRMLGIVYFSRIWNILDLLVVLTSLLQFISTVFIYIYSECVIEDLLGKKFDYPDFSHILYWYKVFTNLTAINTFVVGIKFLKYLSFNKTMTQLSATLSAAWKDLSSFSILFFIVEVAFVQFGYFIFGIQLENFKTLTDSFYTLFRMILGDFNFMEIERANEFIGPIFFLTYIFFVFFVLLNVFLAIINDTYAVVKSEDKRMSSYQMADLIKCGVSNVKSSIGFDERVFEVEHRIKLAAANDGSITYEEFRADLKKLNFSDKEINILFHNCKTNPLYSKAFFDKDDVKMMEYESDRKGSMTNLIDSYSRSTKGFRCGKESRKLCSAKKVEHRQRQLTDSQFLDPGHYGSLENHVQNIENSLVPLNKNLDSILLRIESLARNEKDNKKINRKQMEKIFETIIEKK